jgi:threonine-phosphate decarboxylase
VSVHGGNIYDFDSPGEIIDFSSNINQYGPPPFALNAARTALSSICKYPDTNQTAVRSAFSGWLGVAPDELVFGNGASDLISGVIKALGPRRVVTVAPTFADYAECARQQGVDVLEIRTFSQEGFAFPVGDKEDIFCEEDLFIACQPNNPTGRAWTGGELLSLLDVLRAKGGWLMVDECFVNLTSPSVFTCIPFVKEGGVIVLRAITKDFSAPGLRVGFAVTDAVTARRVRGALQSWPLNCVGEAFAIACASNPEPFLSDSVKKMAVERARLICGLKTLDYAPYDSVVNFILATSPGMPVSELYERLHSKRILIRRCANFSGLDDSYFRIAVRDTADNDAFLCALAQI